MAKAKKKTKRAERAKKNKRPARKRSPRPILIYGGDTFAASGTVEWPPNEASDTAAFIGEVSNRIGRPPVLTNEQIVTGIQYLRDNPARFERSFDRVRALIGCPDLTKHTFRRRIWSQRKGNS